MSLICMSLLCEKSIISMTLQLDCYSINSIVIENKEFSELCKLDMLAALTHVFLRNINLS